MPRRFAATALRRIEDAIRVLGFWPHESKARLLACRAIGASHRLCDYAWLRSPVGVGDPIGGSFLICRGLCLTGERVRRTWLAVQRPVTLDAVFRSTQGLFYIPRRPRPWRRADLGLREAAVKPLVRDARRSVSMPL